MPTTTKSSESIIDNAYSSAGGINIAVSGSTDLLFYGAAGYGGTALMGGLPVNAWTHLAVVRHNGIDTFFLNGTAAIGLVADMNPYTKTSVGIGGDLAGGFGSFVGEIARIRISKVARYLTTFTPSLTDPPLTSDSDTLFLLDPTNSSFVNGSSGGAVMTNNGSVTFVVL